MKYVPTEEQHRLWIQQVMTERSAGKSPEEVHRIIAEMITSFEAVKDSYAGSATEATDPHSS